MRKQLSGSKPGTDWEARFNCNRQPEVKVLNKAFAGISAGARMLVVTPSVVDAAVAEIPFGAVVEAAILRRSLAASLDAEYACPVTTGIALRVVAERAYLRMQAGADSVTPFWRAIDSPTFEGSRGWILSTSDQLQQCLKYCHRCADLVKRFG
jgi:hypothetical protein